ncbi:MAG: thioredoxin family protein [Bacteroidetes bacterium]|nr:MAG: thioredoxin family protein [Bacteroidota bacterium]
MHTFFAERRPHNGWTPAAYQAQWEEKLARPLRGLDRVARRYALYSRYNHERAAHVRAHYRMSEALREALHGIVAPQLWMVLTEDWCGDSAYSLPIIEQAAALSERVDLRILPRDEHLDIMDHYLTNGARSIPRLVAFDASGRELFTWGPRPAPLQALRDRLKAEGADGQTLSNAVIDWYDAGGWVEVDRELAALVQRTVPALEEDRISVGKAS